MTALTPIERLTMIVKNFHQEAHRHNGELASYWLNRFHQELDMAENDGMRFADFPLPHIPNYSNQPAEFHNQLLWGQHNNVTNKRGPDGSTILVNEQVNRRVG